MKKHSKWMVFFQDGEGKMRLASTKVFRSGHCIEAKMAKSEFPKSVALPVETALISKLINLHTSGEELTKESIGAL